MKLYTLNEIIEALRYLSHEQDSITANLKGGSFRRKFENHIAAQRSQRDTGDLSHALDTLVPVSRGDQEVYLLDDIQGTLSKKQFAAFMKFIAKHRIQVDLEDTTYIPTSLFQLFVQEHAPLPVEEEEDVGPGVLRFA